MSTYKNSADYDLVRALIITNTQQAVEFDIRPSIIDIVVYESIFDNCMSGSVTLFETFGLSTKFALGNGETIVLEWNTAGIDDTVRVVGQVFELTGPHSVNDHTSAYTLHFSSPEFIKGTRSRIYNGFNTSTSEMVRSIFGRMSDRSPHASKSIDIEDSSTLKHTVFTGQNLWQAISLCSDQSHSNRNSGYLFYEDNRSFNFRSIDSLYAREPVTEFFYRDQPIYDNVKLASEEMFNVIQDYEVQDSNKYLDDILDGQYGSTSLTLDLKSKTLRAVRYDATQSPGLAPSPFALEPDINQDYTDKVSLRYSLEQNHSQRYEHIGRLKLLKASAYSSSIGVFGNSTLRAGDTALIHAPSFASDAGSGEDVDPISGKVLLASIKHLLNKDGYFQRILLMKDSFEEVVR